VDFFSPSRKIPGENLRIRPRPLFSTSFPIHYSPSYNRPTLTESESVAASLNKQQTGSIKRTILSNYSNIRDPEWLQHAVLTDTMSKQRYPKYRMKVVRWSWIVSWEAPRYFLQFIGPKFGRGRTQIRRTNVAPSSPDVPFSIIMLSHTGLHSSSSSHMHSYSVWWICNILSVLHHE
jgi:hypothetical protein